MSTVITPETFSYQVFQSNFAGVGRLDKDSSGVYQFESIHTASNYVNYNHPTALPAGTLVKFKLKARYVSGDKPRVSMAYFTDAKFSQGKTFNFWDDIDDTSRDWQEIEVCEFLPIGSSYVQLEVGYFQGSVAGVMEFKDVEMTVNKGVNIVLPSVREAKTTAVSMVDNTENGRWDRLAIGAGVVSNVADYVRISSVAPASDNQARLMLDGASSESAIAVKNPKYVSVTMLSKKVSGAPAVFLDYFDDIGGASLGSLHCAISNSDFEEVTLWFSVPNNTKSIRPSVGFASANSGELHVKSINIEVYGGIADKPSSISAATLRKTGGSWVLDNGFNRYSSIGVDSIIESSPAKNIEVKMPVGVYRPTVMCNIRGVDESYSVRVQTVQNTTSSPGTGSIKLQVWKAGIAVDPATLPDDTYISILAVSST